MILDVVNEQNEKVGALDLNDEVFGGRVHTGLIWESVVHQHACERRGTHATKTRGRVSGSGRKPWRQKGTGRARVGDVRDPLWRTGGTVFGPQPRSYVYRLPKKVTRAALKAALRQKLRDNAVTVLDALTVSEPRTKLAVELLGRLGVTPKAILVDVRPDVNLERAARNMPGVRVVASGRLTARDVIGTGRLVATKDAVGYLVRVLDT